MTISISYFLLFAILPTILVCFVTVTASPRPSHSLSQFLTRPALSGGLPFSSLIQRRPFWRSFPSFRFHIFSFLASSCVSLGWTFQYFFQAEDKAGLSVSPFRSYCSDVEGLHLCLVPEAFLSSPRIVPLLLLCWSASFVSCLPISGLIFRVYELQEHLVLTFVPLLGSGPVSLTSRAPLCLTLGSPSLPPSRAQGPRIALWQFSPLRSNTCFSAFIRTIPKNMRGTVTSGTALT